MKDTQPTAWHILLVDDDEEDYILTRLMLNEARSRTITLEWARAYEAGLHMLQSKAYDAVLVDYDLGLRTGIEWIRQAVALGYTSPLILYSGRSSYDIDVEAMEAGATLYVSKNEASPLLLERSLRYAIERKNIEQKAESSRANLEAIVAAQLDIVLFYDLHRNVRQANPAFLEVYGFDPVGLSLSDVIRSVDCRTLDNRPLILEEQPTPRALRGEKSSGTRYRVRRKDGSEGVVETSSGPVRMAGEITGSVTVWHDITEQAHAEQRIRQRNAILAGINRIFREAMTSQTEAELKAACLAVAEQITGSHFSFFREKAPQSRAFFTNDPVSCPVGFDVPAGLPPLQAFLSVPLIQGEQAVSLLCLGNKPGGFTIQDQETVEAIAPAMVQAFLSKRSELALQKALAEADESRRTLDALMTYVPEGITIADANLNVRLVSRHGQELLGAAHNGLNVEQVVDQWTVLEPDGASPMSQADLPLVRAIQRGELVQNQEIIQVNARGQRVPLLCNAGPIHGPEGEITGGVVTWRDISEYKRAGDALRESELRFRSLFNSMTEGFAIHEMITDEAGQPCDYRFVDINPAFERLTGLQREAVIGKTLSQVLPNEDPRWVQEYGKVVLTGEPAHFENYAPALHRYYDVYAYQNAPRQFAVIFMDITSRKQTEMALEQANAALQAYTAQLRSSNEALEDFAFIASHDLKEPLRKVQSFSERLQSRYSQALDAQGQDYIERIRQAASRMQSMLDGLLAYSRAATRVQTFKKVDLKRAVLDVLSDLEVRLMETRGRVEIGELPVIEADPLQMRQLLQNLIGNALKFHRPGTPPLVKVTCNLDSPTEIELVVADNGIGFPMDQVNQLFLPFHRLHGRSEYEGAGMGLAICRKIVERHGGTISARSEAGEGATFVATLPRQPRPQ